MRARLLPLILVAAYQSAAVAGTPALQDSAPATKAYDLAAREAQYRALAAMPRIDVTYGAFGRVRFVEGSTGLFIFEASRITQGDPADGVLHALGPILMRSKSERLQVGSMQDRALLGGGRDLFLDQSIDGIPVIDGGVNVRTNREGEVVAISSKFVPKGNVSRLPKLSLPETRQKLAASLVDGGLATQGSLAVAKDGVLAYWTDEGTQERPVLVWQIRATYLNPQNETESVMVSADAATGEVRHLSRESFGMNRQVWSLHDLTNVVQAIEGNGLHYLFGEGAPNPAYPHAVTAYDNAEKAHRVWTPLGWQYDALAILVDWGVNDNAAYTRNTNGYPYLIFGDMLATDRDAVAHEYGHHIFRLRGPAEASSWWSEWGAMSEFFADVSSVMTDIQDAGVWSSNTFDISHMNVRDLSWPKNPLVYRASTSDYRDWYHNRRFCCSSASIRYSNTTIFGHALFLMMNGGTHARTGLPAGDGTLIPPLVVPGISISQVGALHAALSLGVSNMKFWGAWPDGLSLRRYTTDAAHALGDPALANTIDTAWRAVGIEYRCTAPPPAPNVILFPHYCKGRYDISWNQQPGVTYHGQLAPPAYSWDIYAQTSVDGQVGSCSTNLPATSRFRMRACNACGCSGWTAEEWLQYYSPCL